MFYVLFTCPPKLEILTLFLPYKFHGQNVCLLIPFVEDISHDPHATGHFSLRLSLTRFALSRVLYCLPKLILRLHGAILRFAATLARKAITKKKERTKYLLTYVRRKK